MVTFCWSDQMRREGLVSRAGLGKMLDRSHMRVLRVDAYGLLVVLPDAGREICGRRGAPTEGAGQNQIAYDFVSRGEKEICREAVGTHLTGGNHAY